MAHGRKKPRRAPSKTELAMRNPVWGADKHGPMARELQTELMVTARLAFHRITAGEPHDDDPDSLAVVANVSLILCEWGIGEEYLPRVIEAQDALTRAQLRYDDGKNFNFDGPGAQVWKEVLELHEAHLESAGHLELMRALATVSERIRAGHVIRASQVTHG